MTEAFEFVKQAAQGKEFWVGAALGLIVGLLLK